LDNSLLQRFPQSGFNREANCPNIGDLAIRFFNKCVYSVGNEK